MSSYRLLIELTSEIIIQRSKCYRGLVIAIVIISLVSVFFTIATMSLWPVTGMCLLIPAYCMFLFFDTKILNQWRAQVVDAWKSKTVDFSALRQAITANKALPQLTLQGMLETLPEAGDLVAEQAVPISVREALADVLTARDEILYIKLICRAILHFVIIVTILSAIIVNSWVPLLVLIAVPILLIMCAWCHHQRILKAVKHGKKHRKSSEFNLVKYTEIAETINWQDLSASDKQRLLMFEYDS